jgi:hypothetical protein
MFRGLTSRAREDPIFEDGHQRECSWRWSKRARFDVGALAYKVDQRRASRRRPTPHRPADQGHMTGAGGLASEQRTATSASPQPPGTRPGPAQTPSRPAQTIRSPPARPTRQYLLHNPNEFPILMYRPERGRGWGSRVEFQLKQGLDQAGDFFVKSCVSRAQRDARFPSAGLQFPCCSGRTHYMNVAGCDRGQRRVNHQEYEVATRWWVFVVAQTTDGMR